jgi:hypothetical protein
MPTIRIDANEITDWGTFHSTFKKAFGFPSFYGANMNAWLDCMSDLRFSEDHSSMSNKVCLKPGEVLTLEFRGTEDFSKRCRDILDALVECTAAVNQRYLDDGMPAVSIVFL